jgi:Domain of unknown function (DUF4209)
MTLTIPPTTRAILERIEADQQPTVEYEIAHQLAGLHRADGLADAERKGAWAEAAAFNFTPVDESPWGTYYGPTMTAQKPDGTPLYMPDIAEIDRAIIDHWETRATEALHPILRARYADMVWDFKKRVTGTAPNVTFAQRAIDAYHEAVTTTRYKEPLIHAALAIRRALHLAVMINDAQRIQASKDAIIALFDAAPPGHHGVWTTLFDTLMESRRLVLTATEHEHLLQSLERRLTACATMGTDQFDPWGAEAAARRLASQYERDGKKDEAQRVIRTYGAAFEQLAAHAGPMMAMGWLQPVYDEYRNRGMHEDASRVQHASAEKGKNVSADLKQVTTKIEFTEEQLQQFINAIAEGSPHDALLRIAARFIPNTERVKAFLQELLTTAPLMARIGVTRIVSDHFAAQAGSIEEDPEGRLIMQLAQNIEIENLLLHQTLDHLRTTNQVTTDTILGVLDESPVFTTERRPLLAAGIQAYLDGDATKAIHVIIPQIEQALRQLLILMDVPILKAGRNGTMQYKNLNDILREPAIKTALGEDLRLYLLTFLADERGQNIRNNMCHGLAPASQFNERLADQTLHALLAVALVRKKAPQPAGDGS